MSRARDILPLVTDEEFELLRLLLEQARRCRREHGQITIILDPHIATRGFTVWVSKPRQSGTTYEINEFARNRRRSKKR